MWLVIRYSELLLIIVPHCGVCVWCVCGNRTGSFSPRCIDGNATDIQNTVRKASDLIVQYLGKSAVPIVPLIGPYDVYPHWQLPYGPSNTLSNYWNMWSNWLPGMMRDTNRCGADDDHTDMVESINNRWA
jgi:hypothetical protein